MFHQDNGQSLGDLFDEFNGLPRLRRRESPAVGSSSSSNFGLVARAMPISRPFPVAVGQIGGHLILEILKADQLPGLARLSSVNSLWEPALDQRLKVVFRD